MVFEKNGKLNLIAKLKSLMNLPGILCYFYLYHTHISLMTNSFLLDSVHSRPVESARPVSEPSDVDLHGLQ